jgi:hypothetical protein
MTFWVCFPFFWGTELLIHLLCRSRTAALVSRNKHVAIYDLCLGTEA